MLKLRTRSTAALAAVLVLAAGPLTAASAPEPSFSAALSAQGLGYAGRAAYRVTLDRSLSEGGSRRLRAELGGSVLRAASEPAPDAKSGARLLGEWRTRLYGQYEGAMSYPGMVTRRYDVPAALRPREILPPGAGRAEWIVPATARLTFGAGADDLVRYVAVVADFYCPTPARAVELALFYPRESFDEKEALAEAASFNCLRSTAAASGREPLERAERLSGEGKSGESAAAFVNEGYSLMNAHEPADAEKAFETYAAQVKDSDAEDMARRAEDSAARERAAALRKGLPRG